eukprot:2875515-Rhodomonas_salina.1
MASIAATINIAQLLWAAVFPPQTSKNSSIACVRRADARWPDLGRGVVGSKKVMRAVPGPHTLPQYRTSRSES